MLISIRERKGNMEPTVVTQGEESYSFRGLEVEINGLTTASVYGEIHYELNRYSDRLPVSSKPDVEITKVTMLAEAADYERIYLQ